LLFFSSFLFKIVPKSKLGDILVSIQGKNVIGIRRTAIERILKQYKVDQEIEIVVCRLKDPSFILNLSKLISKQQLKHQQLQQHNQPINLAETAKFRNLNEQIFNELITFQDTSSTGKASNLIANMKKSIRKDIYNYEETASSSKLRQHPDDFKSNETHHQIGIEKISRPDENVLISVPINNKSLTQSSQDSSASASSSSNTSSRPLSSSANEYSNLNETNLISIELNKINNKKAQRDSTSPEELNPQIVVPRRSHHDSVTRNNLSSIINSTNSSSSAQQHHNHHPNHLTVGHTNQYSAYDSGVYNESTSRKSNKSTSYYSDISIVVYDNVANISSSINSGVNSAAIMNNDKRNTLIATSTSSASSFTNNDLVVVSVTQQQQQQQQQQ